MAYIASLTEEKKDQGNHLQVRATYFFTKEGYLQIDTYGSEKRQDPDTVSQTMQFSPEIMKQLLAVILKEYKIID